MERSESSYLGYWVSEQVDRGSYQLVSEPVFYIRFVYPFSFNFNCLESSILGFCFCVGSWIYSSFLNRSCVLLISVLVLICVFSVRKKISSLEFFLVLVHRVSVCHFFYLEFITFILVCVHVRVQLIQVWDLGFSVTNLGVFVYCV